MGEGKRERSETGSSTERDKNARKSFKNGMGNGRGGESEGKVAIRTENRETELQAGAKMRRRCGESAQSKSGSKAMALRKQRARRNLALAPHVTAFDERIPGMPSRP